MRVSLALRTLAGMSLPFLVFSEPRATSVRKWRNVFRVSSLRFRRSSRVACRGTLPSQTMLGGAGLVEHAPPEA